MQNMLIVDDNKQILSLLQDYACAEGYHTELALDGEEALRKFKEKDYHIILLDITLPKLNGFHVCQKIRATSNVPIVMITASGEEYSRIMGLDYGADDYVVKPFSPREVMARIRAIMRRMDSPNQDNEQVISYHGLTVNIGQYAVKYMNESVPLTKKELEILWTLIKNRNKVFSRENLLNSVWGDDYFGDQRTVDSHIKRLRAKLGKHSDGTWDIKTIWGVGYKFETIETKTD